MAIHHFVVFFTLTNIFHPSGHVAISTEKADFKFWLKCEIQIFLQRRKLLSAFTFRGYIVVGTLFPVSQTVNEVVRV